MFGKEVNKTKVEESNQSGNPDQITESEEGICQLGNPANPELPLELAAIYSTVSLNRLASWLTTPLGGRATYMSFP